MAASPVSVERWRDHRKVMSVSARCATNANAVADESIDTLRQLIDEAGAVCQRMEHLIERAEASETRLVRAAHLVQERLRVGARLLTALGSRDAG